MQSEINRAGVFGALLVIAGVLLFLAQQFGWHLTGQTWPLIIIIPGVAVFAVGALVGGGLRFLAVPGGVIVAAGLILFGQSLTDYYQSWAYLWPLLPAVAGLALVVVGRDPGDEAMRRVGWSLAGSGAMLLVIFSIVFEGLIFHGDAVFSSLVIPGALILAGVMIVLVSRSRSRRPPTDRATGSAS